MNNKIKTNEGFPHIKGEEQRMRGHTTRMIDKAIQSLFSGKTIVVVNDGVDDFYHNKKVFDKIRKRLELEHESFFDYFLFDDEKLEITLLDKPLEPITLDKIIVIKDYKIA